MGRRALVQDVRKLMAQYSIQTTIHIDHCRDQELCISALEWGASSVLFDGSTLSFEDNLKVCRSVVKEASTLGCFVEGECSPIPGSEDGHKNEQSELLAVEILRDFTVRSGVFSIAPYFGNAHGDYPMGDVVLDLTYLERLSSQIQVPLVIHGGSGIQRETAQKISSIGAGKVNFSTDFKKVLKRLEIEPRSSHSNLGRSWFHETYANLRSIWRV